MAEKSQKDLAVIIASWNVKDVVLENLRFLFASDPMPALDVFLVDNASSDGTVEAVAAAFPSVMIIANKTNNGFAKACNQGIESAKRKAQSVKSDSNSDYALHSTLYTSPHILLLNPDMRVEKDALAKTVAYLDSHPDVGVVGAQLLSAQGKPMYHMRRFPTVKDQLAVILKLPHIFPRLMHRYHAKDLDTSLEQEVDSVRGSYFAINRTSLEKVGTLDERFYLWFEEVDYCKRVKLAGLKVMYVPSIRATDLVGKSFAQRGMFWKQKLFTKSMIRYFEKWHPSWEVWMLYTARPVGLVAALFADVWNRRSL